MAAAAAVFLASLAPVHAQTPAAGAYTGPRYPGGPDSLRALVYRSTQLAMPGLTGLAVVQFELKEGRQPGNFKLLGPDQPKNSALGKATLAALGYLQAQMPAWQPDPATKSGKKSTVVLSLRFGMPKGAQPYADQEPSFSYLADLPTTDSNHSSEAAVNFAPATYRSLANYIQRQVRYPADALRSHQEGRVNVYFEVAENGAIEHLVIVSSAGNALDAEVLSVVMSLRAATKPAMLQGLPARIYYVLPITFKMI